MLGRILAVGGGKGGVGKSLVSTNLAVALAKTGARVVMLDADLGAPNLHTMFGILRPPRTVEDFLAARTSNIDEVALPTPVSGLKLICGAEGALGSARPTFEGKQRLLAALNRLDADVLLIDCGAGVDLNTIDFFNAADTRIVVMVPEITSLQNGYAFLKIALFRRLQRASQGLRAAEKLNEAFGKEAFEIGSTMDKVSTFFTMIEDEVPELVTAYKLLLAEFNARLVGNMLHKPTDRNALFAIQRMVKERLDIQIDVGAGLRQNPSVRASVNSGRPFAMDAPRNDPDMVELTTFATRLVQQDLSPLRKLREQFMKAMKARPIDPALDSKFTFGLEGVETTRVVAEPKQRAATQPPQPEFQSEFRQLQRASERIKMYVPIELDFDGRWYLGQLTEVNEGGASVSGIRPPATWTPESQGRMRVVGENIAIGATLHNADPLIIRFDDQAAAQALVAELQKRGK
ncbi:MAG: P-loop NTPase [Kofleriaceae bacterium]